MDALRTIAWDVDDVLNDLMRSWFEGKWLIEHPECRLSYDELADNPPCRILGISLDEYLKSLDEYRLSSSYQELKPVREITDWFNKWGAGFRHIALTAAPLIAVSASSQWVFRHFGMWIRTFHFVPSRRVERSITVYDEDKADFLQWLGKADVLVDDSVAHITAAESIGVRGIVMPRPWNKSRKTITEVLTELL